MTAQLYTIDDEGEAKAVSLAEYEVWESSIPKESRTALGKRLRTDTVGSVIVATVFLATPIGYFGRRPQLWITIEIGPGHHEEHVYSSHRAAMSGHAKACRDLRKLAKI